MQKTTSIIAVTSLFIGGGINMIALAFEALIPGLPFGYAIALLIAGTFSIAFGVFYYFYNKEPKANVWLLDAANYLINGKWKNRITENRISRVGAAGTIISQQAEEGNLTIWGRETTQGGEINLSDLNWGFVVVEPKSLITAYIENDPHLVKTYPREHERILLKTNKKQVRAVYKKNKKEKKKGKK